MTISETYMICSAVVLCFTILYMFMGMNMYKDALSSDEQRRATIAGLVNTMGVIVLFICLWLGAHHLKTSNDAETVGGGGISRVKYLFVLKLIIVVLMFVGLVFVPMITYSNTGQIPIVAFGTHAHPTSSLASDVDDAFRVLLFVFMLLVFVIVTQKAFYWEADAYTGAVLGLGAISAFIGAGAAGVSAAGVWSPSIAQTLPLSI